MREKAEVTENLPYNNHRSLIQLITAEIDFQYTGYLKFETFRNVVALEGEGFSIN